MAVMHGTNGALCDKLIFYRHKFNLDNTSRVKAKSKKGWRAFLKLSLTQFFKQLSFKKF